MTSVRISATPDARAALVRAVKEHGPLMFHTSGGRVGGRQYPICLPAEALRLGARDHLFGEVDGVPIYEMEDREDGAACRARAYILDVASGPAIGFSIPAGPGRRFTLMPADGEVCPDNVLEPKT
jgi:uncharacterized protein (DUF779 family)